MKTSKELNKIIKYFKSNNIKLIYCFSSNGRNKFDKNAWLLEDSTQRYAFYDDYETISDLMKDYIEVLENEEFDLTTAAQEKRHDKKISEAKKLLKTLPKNDKVFEPDKQENQIIKEFNKYGNISLYYNFGYIKPWNAIYSTMSINQEITHVTLSPTNNLYKVYSVYTEGMLAALRELHSKVEIQLSELWKNHTKLNQK